jgi:hypothetical protein
LVVEDGAASAAAADEVDWSVEAGFWQRGAILFAGGGVEEGKVYFEPGVLVAADDDAGAVFVEEEDGGVCGRGLQEVVFD